MRPQPFLHDLVTVLAAPTAALSGVDGQLRPGGTQGVLCSDRRLLDHFTVALDGHEPEAAGHSLGEAHTATFTGIARELGDPGADPTVLVRRDRTARADGLTERVTLINRAHQDVHTTVTVALGTDLAAMPAIKAGDPTPRITPERVADGALRWTSPDGPASVVRPTPTATDVTLTSDAAELSWEVSLAPGESWTLTVELAADGAATGPYRPAGRTPWSVPEVRSAVRDLDRLVSRSVADLAGLTLTDGVATGRGPDTFLGAGSPWFFTLLGRDSLWAARMLLPLGTDLAAGTLRVLARAQGTRHDEATCEAPGKIIHEVRSEDGGVGLPPRYYGTIDATPLWVCTLRDAWRWGMPTDEVRDLLGPLRAALDWLTGPSDSDADGFLAYHNRTGTGLANQGWKDSGDAIQWPDGRIADAPIVLCEAQAYAYEAAVAGAELLAACGTDADAGRAAELRDWADTLAATFRDRFWVADDIGRFPALALDAARRPVSSAASNIGHVLGTGLVDRAEAAAIAERLAADDLSDAHGLRTLSNRVAGANPLGYHTGTVWPHDTAIAVLGLAAEGHGSVAARLADGLLGAAPAFDYRLPELFGGSPADEPLLAYPASCRPQAWAACAAITMLTAALGLRPDVPGGTLAVRPDPAFRDWFPLTVSGLQVAGRSLSVTVAVDGSVEVHTDADLTVRTDSPPA
ncbi:MAG: glycogen debranching N-terminal domain-containing protein [Actinocatenispora sp.]